MMLNEYCFVFIDPGEGEQDQKRGLQLPWDIFQNSPLLQSFKRELGPLPEACLTLASVLVFLGGENPISLD